MRAGLFFTLYVALYAVSQFIVFFARGSEPITPFLGITVLKQAQWTAVFVLLLAIPLAIATWRYSQPWPYSAANPVPWPPAPAPASPESRPSADTGTGSESGGGTSAPEARMRRGAGEAKEPVAVAAGGTLADLPEWKPTHPTGGRLRNVFGAHSAGGQGSA
jgi:hypothetical protein